MIVHVLIKTQMNDALKIITVKIRVKPTLNKPKFCINRILNKVLMLEMFG